MSGVSPRLTTDGEAEPGDQALRKRRKAKRSLSFRNKRKNDDVGQDDSTSRDEKEERGSKKRKKEKKEKKEKQEKKEKKEKERTEGRKTRKRSHSASRRRSKQEEADEPQHTGLLVKDFSTTSKVNLVNHLYREEEARSSTTLLEASSSPLSSPRSKKDRPTARSVVRSLSSNLLQAGKRGKATTADEEKAPLFRSSSESLASEVSAIGDRPPAAPVRRRNSMEDLAHMDVPQPGATKLKAVLGAIGAQEDGEVSSPRFLRCGGSVLKLYKGDMLDDDCDSLDTIRGRHEVAAEQYEEIKPAALFSPRGIANMLTQSKKGMKKAAGKDKEESKEKRKRKKRSGESHKSSKKRRPRKSSQDTPPSDVIPRAQTEQDVARHAESHVVASSLPSVVLDRLSSDASAEAAREDGVDIAPAPVNPLVREDNRAAVDGLQNEAVESKRAHAPVSLEEAEEMMDLVFGLDTGEALEERAPLAAEEAARDVTTTASPREEAEAFHSASKNEKEATEEIMVASLSHEPQRPPGRVRSSTTTEPPTNSMVLAASPSADADGAIPQRARSQLTTDEQAAIADLLAMVDAMDASSPFLSMEATAAQTKSEPKEESVASHSTEDVEGRDTDGKQSDELSEAKRSTGNSGSGVEDMKKETEVLTSSLDEEDDSVEYDASVRKGRSPLQSLPNRAWGRSRSSPAHIAPTDIGPPPTPSTPELSLSPTASALSRLPRATLDASPSRSKSWGFTSEEDKIGGDMEETLKFLKRDQQQLSLIKSKKKERASSPFEVFRKKRKTKKPPAESKKMASKCAIPVTLCNGVEVVVAADTVDGGRSVLAEDLLTDTIAAMQRKGLQPSPRTEEERGLEECGMWRSYELSYRLVEIGDLSKGARLNPLKLTKKGERIFLRNKSLQPQFVFKTPSQKEFNPFSELKQKQEKMKDIETAFEAWSKGKPKHRKAPATEAPAQMPSSHSDIVVLGSWSITAPQISTELGQELSKAGHPFYDHVKPRGKRDSFSTASFTVKGKRDSRGSPTQDSSVSATEEDSSERQDSSSRKTTLKRKKLVKRMPVEGVFDGAGASPPARVPIDLAKKERRPAPRRKTRGSSPPTRTVATRTQSSPQHASHSRAQSLDTSGTAKEEGDEEAAALKVSADTEQSRRSPARLSPALRRTGSAMVRVASDDGSAARRLRSFLEMERESLRNATRVRRSFGEEGDRDDPLAASMPIAPAPGAQADSTVRKASLQLPISQILATSHHSVGSRKSSSTRKSVFEVLERKSSHDGSLSSHDEVAPSPKRARSKSSLARTSDSFESSGEKAEGRSGSDAGQEVAAEREGEAKRAAQDIDGEREGAEEERERKRAREKAARLRVSIEEASGDARWEEEDGQRLMQAGHPSHILEYVLQANSLEQEALLYLSTLRYFTDEEWFLQQLCARFRALWQQSRMPPSQQAEPMSLLDLLTAEYERDKYLGGMKKIVRIIEVWTNVSFLAFHQRKALGPLLDDLIAFAEAKVPSGTAMMENISRCAKSTFVGPVLDFAPMPLLPVGFVDGKPKKDTSVMVFDPVEVARQLTLMDFRMVSKLTGNDLFDSAWQGSKRLEHAPNLVPYTERFNHVTFWVVTEVLMAWNSHERVKKIEWFIRLTEELFVLHNFNSVMAVLSGVSMNVVERLKDTWRRVQPELHDTLQTIAYVMQSLGNFKNYRAKLRSITPPFIPFQALVCGDLTRACTGMPSFLEDGLVNVGKLREIAKILRLVRVCQENPYGFYEVPVICDHILSAKVIQDDDELYRLSTACEAGPSDLRSSF